MQNLTRSIRRRVTVAIFAASALPLAAGAARAQGFYYKEVRKDDRIYVFNVAASAERFEKTGEMGVAITRPGAGPNGETIVADSERALQLFFFKYGISEPVPEPAPPPPAAPPYRLSGLIFGDYYYFNQDHDAKWEDQHGLWFRRIYFTYDHTFTPRIAMRFRLEVNSNGKLSGGALTPRVKDAYLRWNFHSWHAVTLGIQPTLSFDFLENIWGLRHIEKTPLDLYKWDASRDSGVTVSGSLNETQTVKYAVQYGQEAGENSEADSFKALRALARYETNPGFLIEGMLARFERDRNADRTTAQVFAAYRARKGRAGFQYSFQKRRSPEGATAGDENLDILSGFGVFDLKPRQSSIFVRVDRYADPCRDCSSVDYLAIDPGEPFTLTIAGFEYYLHPLVRFSPNVEFVAYDSPGDPNAVAPKNDVVMRLTFFWTW
jgi:hypothetical protein